VARFTVSLHDATREHYDLRLEYDGVLASWAVPRGPSLDPGQRRLAVRTPDHDLAGIGFEGAGWKGRRGSGAVVLWDEGTYEPIGDAPVRDALAAGHVVVALAGEKLRGGFALTRTDAEADGWILVKMVDEEARRGSDVVADRPESVRTGRTLEDLRALADVEGG
jgi:bifunctional non-homologous end joining protein LigD